MFVLVLLILIGFAKVLDSKKINNTNELLVLVVISAALGLVIISSTHLAILLLALEGFSLVLYILTTFDRVQGGITAAVKYFSFGTLGSILLF